MTFVSVCAGIEAASMAWNRYGWRASVLCEIEPAPISVLKYRHHAWDARRRYEKPERVARSPMLWGDFAALRIRHMRRFGIAMPDVLAGGTPCQAFSVAGKRLSLDDPRGNLSLAFVKLAHAIDREREREGKPGLVVVWENVPGVLTLADNPFGCLLAGFVGADAPLLSPEKRGRWPDAGLVAGPRAWAAWRVLDAQYFGLAQRRRRVCLVVGFRDVVDPAAILFERAGVRGHPAPRRKAREDVAATLDASADRSRGAGASNPVAHTLNAHGGSGRSDGESETFIVHTLRGEGFDASEDGTGKGTPIVPVVFPIQADAYTRTGIAADGKSNPGCGIGGSDSPMYTLDASQPHAVAYAIHAGALRENPEAGPDGVGVQEDIAYTLEARSEVQAIAFNARQDPDIGGDITGPLDTDGQTHAIAFGSKDYGGDAMEELAPTLRAGGHADSHPNAGVPPAVAINLRGREGGSMPELDELASLRAADGGSSRSYVQQWAVRRLMPVECERLQGFPDDYTLVPHRGKPMADGPRYKMLGNSWAVPKFAWLGARIDAALRTSSDQRIAA